MSKMQITESIWLLWFKKKNSLFRFLHCIFNKGKIWENCEFSIHFSYFLYFIFSSISLHLIQTVYNHCKISKYKTSSANGVGWSL